MDKRSKPRNVVIVVYPDVQSLDIADPLEVFAGAHQLNAAEGRLEAARRGLEDTSEPIATVAAACGFGTAETMRRAFLRALGVAPAEYRRRCQPAATPPGAVAA
jgi:transcriptional regulator GlxA family with amidase domain